MRPAITDLPQNLKLLCSYDSSIAQVCRRLGINRQQFTKYLSGRTNPSISNLRRIGDHFGFEVHELLMDHQQFRRIVAIKRPVTPNVAQLSEEIRKTLFLTEDNVAPLRNLIGYYHTYFRPVDFSDQIVRGLCHTYDSNGYIISRNFERYQRAGHHEVRKFNGIFVHSGENVLMFERGASEGQSLWLSVLQAHTPTPGGVICGLTLGVARSSAHRVESYPVAMEYLGRTPDLRQALRKCALVDDENPSIPADALAHITRSGLSLQ